MQRIASNDTIPDARFLQGGKAIGKYYRLNDRIFARELRVVGPDGVALGILPRERAIHKAKELGLDLVEVAPTASPPVAKIVNFSKFKYEENKKEQQARRNIKEVELKELWFTPRIADNDLQTRLRRVDEFLGENNKVLLRVKFTNREMAHRYDYGPSVMNKIMSFLGERVVFDREPRFEGRSYTAIIGRNKNAGKQKEKQNEEK